MIIRENGEWLRYVFWCVAIGLAVSAIQHAASPEQDAGRIVASFLGVVLFGFSGFVFKTHKVTFNSAQKKITLTHKGFRSVTQQIIPFSNVEHIVIVKTFHYNEDLLPANRWQERWYLALACKEDIVTLTHNPSVQKEEADQLAKKVQRLLGVDILDSDQASLNVLQKTGRKTEAITLATRSLGMTIAEASQHVESIK